MQDQPISPELENVFRDGLENGMTINALITTARNSVNEFFKAADVSPEEKALILDLSLVELTHLLEKEMLHCNRNILCCIIHDEQSKRIGIKVNCVSCLVEHLYWEI